MINQETFDVVKHEYGHFASWAIWKEEGVKSKDNIGDLSVFNLSKNPDLLSILRTDLILVGLNISRPIELPLANFHDSRSTAQDYKIRYAFKNTPFWGAYMTDIIKDFEQISSGKMRDYLKKNKDFEMYNVDLFRKELFEIRAVNPTIIAFGTDAHSVIERNFKNEFQLIKLPHFSNFINPEKYREEVISILSAHHVR